MTSSFGSVSFARPSTRLRRAPLAALVLAGLAFAAPSFADSTKEELEESESAPRSASPSQAPADSLATPDENPSVPSVATPDGEGEAPAESASSGTSATGAPRSFRAFGYRGGLELDVAPVSAGTSNVAFFGATAVAQVPVFRNLLVTAELPMSFASGDALGDAETFALGNLSLGSHWAFDVENEFAVRLGGLIAIPTMLVNPDAADAGRVTASYFAAAARGLADYHRYAAGYLGIRFGGDLEAYLSPNLIFRTSAYPAIYAPVRETGGGALVASLADSDAQFFIDQVNELEYRLDSGLGLGVRVQEVFTLTADDKIQTAVEPFLAYEAQDSGLTARLGAFLPLDEGIGPFWEEGNPVAVRTSIGAKF